MKNLRLQLSVERRSPYSMSSRSQTAFNNNTSDVIIASNYFVIYNNQKIKPRKMKSQYPVCTSFFQSILRWSVAVSTICRQSSRVVAFFQAVARPKFRGPRSASSAWSQVWLGGCFQLGGTCRTHAARVDGGPRKVNCEQYGGRAILYQYTHNRTQVMSVLKYRYSRV